MTIRFDLPFAKQVYDYDKRKDLATFGHIVHNLEQRDFITALECLEIKQMINNMNTAVLVNYAYDDLMYVCEQIGYRFQFMDDWDWPKSSNEALQKLYGCDREFFK